MRKARGAPIGNQNARKPRPSLHVTLRITPLQLEALDVALRERGEHPTNANRGRLARDLLRQAIATLASETAIIP